MLPSGTNLMIGATSALPSWRAMASVVASEHIIVFPKAPAYGPFGSIPPVPTMTVVLLGLHGVSHFHPGQFFKKDAVQRGDGPWGLEFLGEAARDQAAPPPAP